MSKIYLLLFSLSTLGRNTKGKHHPPSHKAGLKINAAGRVHPSKAPARPDHQKNLEKGIPLILEPDVHSLEPPGQHFKHIKDLAHPTNTVH